MKLLDFDEAELLASENPCALLLLAFRKAMETEGKDAMRLEARKELVRLMVNRGYDIDTQAELLRLMEWAMGLPELLEQAYEEFLEEMKQEQGTTFLSALERRAIREGLQQGLEQGLQQGLQQGEEKGLREGLLKLLQDLYGAVPERLVEALQQVAGTERLLSLYTEAVRAGSIEAFEQQLANYLPTSPDGG